MTDVSATAPTLIQSLQRGLRLVEAVAQDGPVTARTLSERTGMVLPTAYHLLRTLVHEGYLGRGEGGAYILGPQLRMVSDLERRARSLRLVRQAMSALATEVRGTAILGELQAGEVVATHVVGDPRSPRLQLWPGLQLPAHATAIGRIVLARMDPDARTRYLDNHDLEGFTTRTITTRRRLEEQLPEDERIVRCDEHYAYDISCVAVPVGDGPALSTLGVAFSVGRSPRSRGLTEAATFVAARQIVAALAGRAGDVSASDGSRCAI